MSFTPTGPMPVEVYASTTSVMAGDFIGFHASATPAATDHVTLQIYRSSQLSFGDNQFGTEADILYQSDYRPQISVKSGETPVFQTSFPAANRAIPANVSTDGCNWPRSAAWNVPADQPSSVYIARLTHGSDVTYAVFTVRPRVPGALTKVLLQLSDTTYQAYNPWGGNCFYGPLISLGFAQTVSFDRPCQLWDYILYDEPIVTWLEANTVVEFCTNTDLDRDPGLLASYQVLISCGHDEYWSAAMRDSVEQFAAGGGNVLFLSGNTSYRPVGFAGRQMTRLDGDWRALGRPEALTTGVNWSAGRWSQALPSRGYTVRMPSHWIFDGTGLTAGSVLGGSSGVIGYETDAGVYDGSGNPISPSPSNLVKIAEADLSAEWVDLPGFANIAAHWRGQGYVMSAGSTGWGQGLRGAGDPAVTRVMTNMVSRMRYRFGIIYTVDSGNLRWYRDWNQNGTGDIGTGSTIGTGGWDSFKFLTADETGVIYAVTASGDLLWYRDYNRDGTGDVSNARTIGHGGWDGFQFVFSGGGGILYAVTPAGDLLWYRDYHRDGTGDLRNGRVIGHGGWNGFQFVFSGGEGAIYAVTPAGDLRFYRDWNRDGTGDVGTGFTIGHGGWNSFVRVFADSTGIIYAVTPPGELLAYKDYTRNGTGDVANGPAIGHGGWSTLQNTFSGS